MSVSCIICTNASLGEKIEKKREIIRAILQYIQEGSKGFLEVSTFLAISLIWPMLGLIGSDPDYVRLLRVFFNFGEQLKACKSFFRKSLSPTLHYGDFWEKGQPSIPSHQMKVTIEREQILFFIMIKWNENRWDCAIGLAKKLLDELMILNILLREFLFHNSTHHFIN